MLKTAATIIAVLFCSYLLNAPSAKAYVVIDNYSSGDDAYAGAVGSPDSDHSKATGVVSEDLGGNTRADNVFGVAAGNGSGDDKQLVRYQGYQGGGASGSGGGGGGGARRGGSSGAALGAGGAGFAQTIVSVTGSSNGPILIVNGNNTGINLGVFGCGNNGAGSGAGGSGAGGSGGSGGSGSGGSGAGGSGGGGTPVYGTPEPAALAVWTIASCCGYGVVRFRKRWSTES